MRNPITLLSQAWELVRQNIPLYIGILLIPSLLSYLAAIFMPPEAVGFVRLEDWAVYLSLFFVSIAANVFMSIALMLAIDNPSLTIGQSYRASLGFFWRYVGLTMLLSIVVTIGFILLFIPGLLMSVWFAFAAFVLVFENVGIKDSMMRSREYVRGHWWGVFGRLMAMMIFAVALGFLFGIMASFITNAFLAELVVTISSMVLVPILVGYTYLMYQDLKQGPTSLPSFAPGNGEQPTALR